MGGPYVMGRSVSIDASRKPEGLDSTGVEVLAGAERIRDVTAGRRTRVCRDGGVSERRPCPGGLSDERRALIEPVITVWKAARDHRGGYEMREIVNAILCDFRLR
jgi:hypothetical protein